MLDRVQGELRPLAKAAKKGTSPLLTGLSGYWKLDESSGDAVDSSGGGLTLTNVGTLTYAAGKINNGATYAVGKYHSRADEAALRASLNMTLSGWFKTSAGGTQALFSKDDGSGTDREYIVFISAGGVQFYIFDAAGASSNVTTAASSYGDGAWHYVVASVLNGKARIAMDGGAFRLGAATIASVTATPTAPFLLGRRSTSVLSLTGMLDECGLWQRAWDDSDIALGWNSGSGRTPF